MQIKQQSGFTLIEMVIVIAVVGILMGLAFNGIRGVQSAARDTRRAADLRATQSYLELYFSKYNKYPTGMGNWGTLKTTLEDVNSGVANSGEVPLDPFTGRQEYLYASDADGTFYVIGATMEKVKPQTGLTSDPAGTGLGCAGAKVYCIRS